MSDLPPTRPLPDATTGSPLPVAALANAAVAAENAVLSASDGSEPAWAKPAIAIASLSVFAGMMAWAFITHDDSMKQLLAGSVIGMAGTAVNYYLGSSSGSDKKTSLLAAAPPVATSGAKS